MAHPNPELRPVSQSFHRWAVRFLLLATAGVLLVALVLLGYSQPVFDDFARARVPLSELGEYISSRYRLWTGRWAALATIIVITELVEITRSYWLTLLPLLALELLAGYALLSALFPGQLTRLQRVAGVAVGAACFWAGMPEPWETMYWLTGNIENQFSLSLAMLLVAGLVSERPRGRVGALALAALAAFTIGLHELYGLMTCIVLGLGTAVAFRVRATNRLRWAFVLLVAALAFGFVYAAPGNAVRGRQAGESAGELLFTLKAVAHHARGTWLPWIVAPQLLALTAVVVLLPAVRRLRAPWLAWPGVRWRLLLPATTFVCVLAGTAGPLWALGRGIPGRTLDGIYLVFLVGWIASVFVLVRDDDGEPRLARSVSPHASAIALSLLAVSLLASPNLRDAVLDWRYNLRPWRAAVQQRFQLAREARAAGESRLELPPEPSRARTHRGPGLSMDPWADQNRHFARYYDLDWVWIRWPEGEDGLATGFRRPRRPPSARGARAGERR